MNIPREIRILIKFKEELKPLFKMSFSNKDASIYFFPYGPKGKYYYGIGGMVANQPKKTFNYKEQNYSDVIPKLSIHQSGQVHVYGPQKPKAGPLFTLPLEKWKGEHIATITADNFTSLAQYERKIKNTKSQLDHIIPVEEGVNSGRIIVYCNANKPQFKYKCRLKVPLKTDGGKNMLYFGFAPMAQKVLDNRSKGGVNVITGWNPLGSLEHKEQFLWIRAE